MAPTLQFGPNDVFFIEDWASTPVGPYCGMVHFTPEDRRSLFASTQRGMDLLSTIHRADEKHLAQISSHRDADSWEFTVDGGDGGRFEFHLHYEANLLKAANLMLPLVPKFIALNPLYLKLAPKLAAPLLGTPPDYTMAGVTEMGRDSAFKLDRVFLITGGSCVQGGRDLGPLTQCCFRHDMGAYRPSPVAMMSELQFYIKD